MQVNSLRQGSTAMTVRAEPNRHVAQPVAKRGIVLKKVTCEDVPRVPMTSAVHLLVRTQALDMKKDGRILRANTDSGYVCHMGQAFESSPTKPRITVAESVYKTIPESETSNAENTPDQTYQDPGIEILVLETVSMPELEVNTSNTEITGIPMLDEKECNGLDSDNDDDFYFDTIEDTAFIVGREMDIQDDELDESISFFTNKPQQEMEEIADRLPSLSFDFNWVENFETFRGKRESFSGPTPGSIKDYDTPYDAFTDIWSRDIMDHIAWETNRYAAETIAYLKTNGELKEYSRYRQWRETDADELYVFFAVLMYMGFHPRTRTHEYWSTKGYLEMPKFRQLIPYLRFTLLNRFLHFVDSSDTNQDCEQASENLPEKFWELAPVIEHLNFKFRSLYNLHAVITINDSLNLYKDRLPWHHTIISKSSRFDIKSYELSEAASGYVYRLEMYSGETSKETDQSVDLGDNRTKVVLDLLKGLEHRGHCVVTDHFYNSPALARYLKNLGFDCLGTLRVNRENMPNDIVNLPNNLPQGTIVARHSGDVSVLAWKDSRLVTMISTYHGPETCVTNNEGKSVVKPASFSVYNRTMGRFELKRHKLTMYPLERQQNLKCYITMFKRLLNVSVLNTFIMLRCSLGRRGMGPVPHHEFRCELADAIVRKHLHSPQIFIRETTEALTRLRKDIDHVPNYVKGSKNRKRCYICYQDRNYKLVNTHCMTCNEFVCFPNCWSKWHNEPKLGEVIRSRIRVRRKCFS